MTKRSLLTTAIAYCAVLLVVSLMGGILVPCTTSADGGGSYPPPDTTPENTSENPEGDLSGSIALVDLLLGAWALTL